MNMPTLQKTIFPNFLDSKVVDENGMLTDTWRAILSQVLTQLQINFSHEGLKIPQQSTTNVNALNTSKSIGSLLYDKDTNQLKVNINGTYKVVQTL